MDMRTGELYKSLEEAEQDIKKQFDSLEDSKETIEKRLSELMPINEDEYKELEGMNRAERRRWARQKQKEKRRNKS